MKYLSHYINDLREKIFNELGAFFAKNEIEYNDKIVAGKKYVSLGKGYFVPKENEVRFIKEINSITEKAIKMDLQENGKTGVIERELENHDCFITMDISICINKLKAYNISSHEIEGVYSSLHSEKYQIL